MSCVIQGQPLAHQAPDLLAQGTTQNQPLPLLTKPRPPGSPGTDEGGHPSNQEVTSYNVSEYRSILLNIQTSLRHVQYGKFYWV